MYRFPTNRTHELGSNPNSSKHADESSPSWILYGTKLTIYGGHPVSNLIRCDNKRPWALLRNYFYKPLPLDKL